MTIKAEIRSKVIELAKEGKGRNQIAFELHIVQGTVSNILKELRETFTTIPTSQSKGSVCIEQNEQSLQYHLTCNEAIIQQGTGIITGVGLTPLLDQNLEMAVRYLI